MDQARKVLIVEDDQLVSVFLSATLKRKGYVITEIVATGEKAIKSVAENPPDIILMDIMIEGDINGIETSLQIQNYGQFPLIFITGADNYSYLAQASASNPGGYLHKPVEPNQLFSTIEIAIQKSRVEQELKERIRALNSRSKVSETLSDPESSFETKIAKVAAQLPELWGKKQCPDFLINFKDKDYKSADFDAEHATFSLCAPILSQGQKTGKVCALCFAKDQPKKPFNYWDKNFIESTADKISELCEKSLLNEKILLLAFAIEQSPSAIVMTDSEGNINFVNQATVANSGYSRDELLGSTPRIFKSGHQEKSVYEKMWKTITTGGTWHGVLVNKRKNGELHSEDCMISPVRNSEGKITHFVGQKKDISKERDLELQLAHARKMEAVGQLAAGIAHEINTPIQYLAGNMEFIAENQMQLLQLCSFMAKHNWNPDNVSPKDLNTLNSKIKALDLDFIMQEIPLALAESQQGVERISTIVKSMIKFSHPGNRGKMVLVSPNDLLETTITIASNEWKPVARIEKNFVTPDPPLLAYPNDLGQVFLNIIVNAAHCLAEKYGSPNDKGVITITTSCSKGMLQITIADNGTGIPDKYKDRIFDQFFTTKEVGKGTGQGLAIAYRIVVETHKGNIFFNTVSGKGTAFIIELPLADEQVTQEQQTILGEDC